MSWDLPGPPDIENTNNTWTNWTYYNARSLLYWYRNWNERTLTVTPVDSFIIELVLAGRLDDPEDFPSRKGEPRWDDDVITLGEVNLVTDWLAFHLDAEIREQFVANQRWLVDVSGWGRFVPSGGQTPRLLLRNDS